MSNVVITVRKSSTKNLASELWQYRELFYFLAWKEVLVRYKQTAFGIAWAVIQPLLMMVVFTVVFGKVAKLPSNGIPYPILSYSALLAWQFFANSITQTSGSVLTNQGMISKIYFPRLIVPMSSVIAGMLDFAISFLVFLVMMFYYKMAIGIMILCLPAFFLLVVLFSAGVGLWLSALNVAYRDVKYVVPFVVQLGMYVSPVGFLSSVVPSKYQLLYSLNPMVGIIDGFRWSLLAGKIALNWEAVVLSVILISAIFASGVLYFQRMQKSFADII